MNIMDMLTSGDNAAMIGQIARQFGLPEDQAKEAIGSLVPSLTRGLQHRTQEDIGVDDLIEALNVGKHSRYFDEPERLGREDTVKDGNDILGHIFGSKEVSRNVARHAGKQTGLGSSLMKKMLPVVASMVMASLGKKMLGGGGGRATRASSGGLLTSLLDSDGDGSIIDDVLGMAFKAAIR
ncbi:MAG TPA: DUF937 domain-containing protein [Thiothrix sp.]|nr:DUF937 domain-containing protein [Thiothrix sp.]